MSEELRRVDCTNCGVPYRDCRNGLFCCQYCLGFFEKAHEEVLVIE